MLASSGPTLARLAKIAREAHSPQKPLRIKYRLDGLEYADFLR
jgi:hypothetical protein